MRAIFKIFFPFLLITAAAYALSTLFLSYLDRELGKDLPLPAPAKSSVERRVAPQLPPGEYPEPIQKRAATEPRAQEKPGLTSLNLKLLGTVVNEKGSSWAIIQDLDRDRQHMVSVGSVVAGARVLSIEKDKVVLDINGREEILLLGMEGTRSPSGRPDQGTRESAASTYVLSREVLRQNLENLPGLMTQARAELYFQEGRPEGFQLSQIQQGSLLKSVGFQDGDVIRTVNGRDIRSLEDAIEIYRNFVDNDSFTIGILRGEKPRTLHVKIK